VSPFRLFHPIAALCGNGLRPELQALFDRLAVDPHSELLGKKGRPDSARPGPDFRASSISQAVGETRTQNADSSRHLVVRIKVQAEAEILPVVHRQAARFAAGH